MTKLIILTPDNIYSIKAKIRRYIGDPAEEIDEYAIRRLTPGARDYVQGLFDSYRDLQKYERDITQEELEKLVGDWSGDNEAIGDKYAELPWKEFKKDFAEAILKYLGGKINE